ncbi:hypothetical protein ABL78_0711 [Leptomonas seymouri]|uniref:Leucine-rich repeat protein (LRRP) n=1 Tax=Leptomonas seymouri TaxID=5684 RepID=A0A0N1PGB5_LEPSE|nr:hypothetical protein ABL78_0711 [Leptomonas seymouri]|eukprot:KPI90193.1 hypothetical protein ABL78_0711 [Leptomonas seymouri]
MNEDSGGAADDTVYFLSAQEEAALLAEYGTEGPFDDGIDWAAPSRFKSGLGDGDVFLTAAARTADDDATTDQNREGDDWGKTDPSLEGRLRLRGRPEYKDPLTLYLLRHAPSLILPTRLTPAPFAQSIASMVNSFEDTGAVDGGKASSEAALALGENGLKSASRFAPVLRSGKEWERRAALAVQGIPTTAFASYLLLPEASSEGIKASPLSVLPPAGDDSPGEPEVADVEFDKLVSTTANMLRDADGLLELLALPADAAQDEAEVQREIEERQRCEVLGNEDFLDQHWAKEDLLHGDEDDESTRELLLRAREGYKRIRVALMLSAATGADVCGDDKGGAASACAVERSAANAHSPQGLTNGLLNSSEAKEEVGVLPSSVPLYPEDEYLYAFEIQLPSTVTAWEATRTLTTDDADTNEQPSFSPVGPPSIALEEIASPSLADSAPQTSTTAELQQAVSIPQLIECSAALLESIAAAEERDTQELQQLAENQGRRRLAQGTAPQQRTLAHQITKKGNLDALGLVALPSFVERLDVLLSPTHDEQMERYRCRDSNATETNQMNGVRARVGIAETTGREHLGNEDAQLHVNSKGSKTSGGTTALPSPALSLDSIRRRAAIESFLLFREIEEGRCMRKEDELVEREVQAVEEMQQLYSDRVAALQDDALRSASAMLAEEAAAFKELVTAQVKDATLTRQVEQLRQLQQVEALAYTLMMEWEVQREQLLQDEALTFRRLGRDAEEAKTLAGAAMEKRERAEAEAALACLMTVRKAFEESRSLLAESLTNAVPGKASLQLHDTSWYRWYVEPLIRERVAISRWAVSQRKQMESLRDLVTEAELRYRRHTAATASFKNTSKSARRIVTVPEAPPTKNSSTVAEANALNTETLLRVMWPAFRAAVLKPRQAAQYLARWCLSLEAIGSIEWKHLQSLELESLELGGVGVAANDLVKDVDLSGNQLRGIDVLQAVRTFPLLQRLILSHAELQRLDVADPAQSLQPRGDPPHLAPAHLSPSSALSDEERVSSASSSHLRHISAARSHALAEQVHLLEIDASSNHLTSLAPLGVMATSSLTRCAAVDNKITSLDAVSSCTQLRVITMAHNKLKTVLCLQGLRLLRELDVGNNALDQFDDDVGQAKGGATTNPVPLLSKLFVSHNRLKRLPSSFHCVYPCLSRLFINHNELTSLDEETMAWFPLLRVLQAEGNKLASISGLQHCSRLETLKLSHNLLSSTEALLPLVSCRRLKTVDLSGNPLYGGGGTEEGLRSTRFLCDVLPWLQELNNTPLQLPAESGSPLEDLPLSDIAVRCAKEARGVAQVTADAGAEYVCAAGNEFNVGWASSSVACPTESYREVFAALCWDAMLQHAQDERELREALVSRALNRAKGWEATMTAVREVSAKGADSESAAVTALYGITAAQRDTRRAECETEIALFKLDHTTLSDWLTLGEHCASQQLTGSLSSESTFFSNRHEIHSAYRQRQEDELQKLARTYITEWVHSRVLLRRARRVLLALRSAHQQSEAFRREAAARRIQPIWRGAALRSRLHRLLHGSDSVGAGIDDDEHDAFAKVDVNDWLTEDAFALAPVELLLHTVVNSAREVDTVPFDVPREAAKVPVVVGSAAQPALNVPEALPNPTKGGAPNAVERPTANTDTLDDQWGPAVAAQIRKKQQKNTRANAERRRKEFLQDPLRVQQEMRRSHTGHHSK